MGRDDERNMHQIIRKDARACFVESKSDCFHLGKAHLEFAAYDMSRAQGSRFTNHVHIYIDIAGFLELCNEAVSGYLHAQMRKLRQLATESERNPTDINLSKQANTPLYETLGGTAAQRMREPRSDGMSQSRCMKLFAGKKQDYLLCAESGPGKTDAKGLIVPQYGNKPEQRVTVAMDWRNLTQLLLMTKAHYEAWLTAEYLRKSNDSTDGRVNGSQYGNISADDTRMY